MDSKHIDSGEFDVIVKVCDFTTPSKSAGKVIDENSFQKNVIINNDWKNRLKKGQILGLFTHKGRQPEEQCKKIPYVDNIAASPYLCNVAKGVWVENSVLYAGLDLFKDKEYGKMVADLLKRGIMIPVSMSVKAHSDFHKYYVEDLLGIDFTFKPDLEAEVVQVNFSENDRYGRGSKIYHFSSILGEDDIVLGKKLFSFLNNYEDYTIFIKKDLIDELKKLGFKYKEEAPIGEDVIPVVIHNISKITQAQKDWITKHDADFSGNENAGIKVENPGDEIKNKPIYSLKIAEDGNTKQLLDNCKNLGITDISKVGNLIILRPENINDDLETKIHNLGFRAPNDDVKTQESFGDMQDVAFFSDMDELSSSDPEMIEFSIQHYLMEAKYTPAQILKKRIAEVIKMLMTKKKVWVETNSELLKSYIDSYVMRWVQSILNIKNEKFNIIAGLRLNMYGIPMSDLRELQLSLNKAKDSLENTSTLTPQMQKRVNKAFQNVTRNLYAFINTRAKASGNQLI